ncbi:MAG TPA: bile acid:sodium symporter [Spirochaetota bacterium]
MRLSRKTITNIGIFVAIILGIIFPASMWEKKTLPYILGLLLVGNFLKIDLHLHKFFRKELLYFPLIGLLIFPFIVYFGSFFLPLDLRLGLFIIAITPSAIASPVVVDMIDGDRELGVAQVLFSNVIAPVSYSGLLYLFFRTSAVSVPVGAMFRDITLLIIIPFFFSRLITLQKNIYSATCRFFSWFGPIGFLLVIFVAVASSSAQLRKIDPEMFVVILAMTAFLAVLNFSTGYILSRKSNVRRTLAVGFGHKNTSLSVWVAMSNFNPIVVLPMVSYLIFHHIMNGILVHRFHK